MSAMKLVQQIDVVFNAYLPRPSLRRAKPLKQLLAIILVFTVAIVLTLGRGMAPRCAVT
jgi:hypothetical protein